MARGETSVICPHCNCESRIPFVALRRNSYHCSKCGAHIPLEGVSANLENRNAPPSRPRSKSPAHRRKRR